MAEMPRVARLAGAFLLPPPDAMIVPAFRYSAALRSDSPQPPSTKSTASHIAPALGTSNILPSGKSICPVGKSDVEMQWPASSIMLGVPAPRYVVGAALPRHLPGVVISPVLAPFSMPRFA